MKNNLFHIAPPLYVQNKNRSRDCKSIPHLNLTFLAHYGVLSSRVANRCASNNDCLCAVMSSCSKFCQISRFRHRDTAETDVPKSDAISVSVFPAKDISHAVKIVFVFERRILNSSRKYIKNLAFQPFTQLILLYLTLLVKLKLQNIAFFCEKNAKPIKISAKFIKSSRFPTLW